MRWAMHFELKKNKEQGLTGLDSARPMVREVAKKTIPGFELKSLYQLLSFPCSF